MAQLTCPNLQQSIKWCEGTPEYAGLKRKIYFISKGLIVKYPTLPVDDLKRATDVAYTGNFELAEAAKWHSIDTVASKNQLTSEPQGEAPGQTQLNKLTAVLASCGAEASAAALYLNNNDNIFLVEDMKGNFRVVGNDKWETKTTVSQDSGQGATGTPGTTINAEVPDLCPAPFYKGLVDAEDGKFMADGSEVIP